MRGPQSRLAAFASPIRPPREEVRDRGLYPTAQTDAGLPAEECTGQKPGWATTGKSGCKRFPFNNFTCCLTLFPKCFSSFDHSTCALSVSGQYLALEEIYLPFRAAFPNNSTRRRGFTRRKLATTYGILTLCDVLFQGTWTAANAKAPSANYNSDSERARFQIWAVAASLAVTRAIPVGFFSSAYWYA